MCLSLVVLLGKLGTHLPFPVNITLTQPCAQISHCPRSQRRWIYRRTLGGRCPGPSAELPVGMAGWAASQLPSLVPPPLKGTGFCSPGGQPCPTPRGPSGHSPVSLFLGVLPGPFIQGRAPQLTVSLSSPRSGDQARAPPYGCVGCTSLLKRRWLQGGDHMGRPPQTAGLGLCG